MQDSKSSMHIEIDAAVKEQATQLLRRMGLDQNTAVELFYRQIIAEHRLPFQPSVAQAYDEQILDAVRLKNIPHKAVELNEEGHILADKDKDPELYDWAVNG